ncbi:hypothetical protein [Actinomadura fibrosa]|uniref:Uncharacterized protein n=1 Tax=Actinomadura fibrosa TaxID=111802 RepID=A0ABW2XYV5_9ACTN|nr:hypothetical protein [Actinomadura fibrosa]
MNLAVDEQHLSELAAELDAETFKTSLSCGNDHTPELKVVNRSSGRLSERIKVCDGHYMWSWNERIAPVTERALAARRVSNVLGSVGG